jgi:prepilin-type N-terminal cleavage/methylation domain-containing protein
MGPQMHRCSRSNSGFTLIELTVVLAIISIVFFFSIPRLRTEILTDQSKKTSRWLLLTVRSLKEHSLREKKDYVLHIDTDAGAFWTSQRSPKTVEEAPDMMEKKTEGARYQLPEDMRILDVEFPGDVQVTTGEAEIFFYAKGYSDAAFIHLEDETNQRLSFQIQPFLLNGRYYERYVGFE